VIFEPLHYLLNFRVFFTLINLITVNASRYFDVQEPVGVEVAIAHTSPTLPA